MTVEDFFAPEAGRGGIARDYEGNALIVPSGGTRPMSYTPASGLADHIEDARHIHRWQMRYLAKGMGQSPDLCELAASEPYSTSLDAAVFGKDKTASGRRLDRIAERAMDRVGIDQKADRGTAIHAWTEPGNGQPVSEGARADVESFWAKLQECGIRIVATEVFTANDTVKAAGTFDHLVWAPGYGFVISDKKTGKLDAHHFGVQLSVYSQGEVYDRESHERNPLEILTGGADINRDVGLVFAIGDGKTTIHEIDLERGWRGAQAAAAARDYQEERDMMAPAEGHLSRMLGRERESLAVALGACEDRAAMLALHAANEHLWTEELTAQAKELLS